MANQILSGGTPQRGSPDLLTLCDQTNTVRLNVDHHRTPEFIDFIYTCVAGGRGNLEELSMVGATIVLGSCRLADYIVAPLS